MTTHDVRQIGQKKLVILGHGLSWRLAPFGDDTWDIWGMNHLFLYMEPKHRVTAWFELHHSDDFNSRPKDRRDWLSEEHDFPVFVHNHEESERFNQTAFPRTRIERSFDRGHYHASSADWMLALAILEGYEEIAFWGFSSVMEGEPPSMRSCLEYWVGVAEGRGITISVPGDTDLLFNVEKRGGQYAYTRDPGGLGATYMQSGIAWQNAPHIGHGCKIGREGHLIYVGFPAALPDKRED